jgi:hypothetical protein
MKQVIILKDEEVTIQETPEITMHPGAINKKAARIGGLLNRYLNKYF